MLQLCNIARNILREVVFCNLSHSGTRKMCLSRIYHSNLFNFPGLFVLVTCFLVFSVWLFATTRCKSTLRHCTVFWLKWPVHDLLLVIPPPLLIKVASNIQDHAQNLEEQLWMEERREVSIIRYLTDLLLAPIWSKKGRFFVRLSPYFATGCSSLLRKV